MKTSNLIPALFVCSLLGFTACTPRDVQVGTPAQRANIRNLNKNGGGGGRPSGDQFSLTNYSLASFLAEKQIEAIELVKTATGSIEVQKSPYSIENKNDKADGQKSIVVTAVSDSLEYDGIDGAWKTKQSKKLDVSFARAELVESLVAVPAQDCVSGKDKTVGPCILSASVDSANKKKFYVNFIEKSYRLTATTLPAADQLKIEVTSGGQIVGAKGGKNDVSEVKTVLTMVVDKASLETSSVKVLQSNVKMEYPSPKKDRVFSMILAATNLVVNIDSKCNSLEGTVAATAGPKKFNVSFDKTSISVVGQNWDKEIADCGSRPTVDLSRLQVY